MELIGQSVPHRHAGILCKFFNQFLAETAVFDAVVHPAEDACSIGNTFLFAHL